MDTNTLIIAIISINLFYTIAYLIYWKTVPTHPGFHKWSIAMLLNTVVYLLFAIRPYTYEWISILGATTLVSLSCVLRLHATTLFMENKVFNKYFYLLPVVSIPIFSSLYFFNDLVQVRSLILSSIISFFFITVSLKLIKYSPKGSRSIYYYVATIMILRAVTILIRSIVLFPKKKFYLIDDGFHPSLFILFILISDLAIGLLFFAINSQKSQFELIKSNKALKESLNEIKKLKGILPICSYCKKIKDDKGHYQEIETYIHKQSGVDFSHGICPDCMKKHHPELILHKKNLEEIY